MAIHIVTTVEEVDYSTEREDLPLSSQLFGEAFDILRQQDIAVCSERNLSCLPSDVVAKSATRALP